MIAVQSPSWHHYYHHLYGSTVIPFNFWRVGGSYVAYDIVVPVLLLSILLLLLVLWRNIHIAICI